MNTLWLRPLNTEGHLQLILTSYTHMGDSESVFIPTNIPRVEDGLSDSEEEQFQTFKDATTVRKAVSAGSHASEARPCMMLWSQLHAPHPRLAHQDELCSEAKTHTFILKTGSPWQESLKSELETELEEKKQSALRSPPRREHKRVKRPADKQVPRGQREALQETQTTDDLSASFLPLMSRSTWRSNSANVFQMHYQVNKERRSGLREPDFCSSKLSGDDSLDTSVSEGTEPKGSLTFTDPSPKARKKLKHLKKYSKDAGFTELVCKKGKRKLKDLANGFFRYKNGIVVSRHGPFWPVGFRQLCPTPVHIIICPDAEALWSKDTQGLDCKMGIMSQPWRRKVLVFDSEKYTKNPLCQMPEDSGPSLQFESSGEFEYELLLKTDLFTNKHTQWYYFQVKNAVPGVTYKFRIINLLKRDSLYNHGMKPLVYSEKGAKEGQVGWFRSGHHIVYKPWNNPSYNILLLPFVQYYCLEFLIEFSHAEDTYYLAHSYPYHYSTLLSHLNGITEDPQRSAYVKKEALCKTLARNTCFLLTVTDFEVNTAESCSSKLGVVLTARVHPGETPSSWVMKGVLDFLTSEEPLAQELRRRFVFKLVPMLNPDGVIVGNYRCSLAAQDLNRNYHHPERKVTPTVWHTKQMIEEFQKDHGILLYCDLHGHSRKPHVFMYGCNQASAESSSVSSHLRERIFPFLVSQKDPHSFDWKSCRFHVKRNKESTGRVVMYRQLGIHNSFTMEASFSGTFKTDSGPRHFSIRDYLLIGRHLCESILDYASLKSDPIKLNELILQMSHSVAQQVSCNRKRSSHSTASTFTRTTVEDPGYTENTEGCTDTDDTSEDLSTLVNKEKVFVPKNSETFPVLQNPDDDFIALEEQVPPESLQRCLELLKQLTIVEAAQESYSSEDSDSESEPATKCFPPNEKIVMRQTTVSADLPVFTFSKVQDAHNKLNTRRAAMVNPLFVNRYANRSNGGIPIYSQERLLERAKKKEEIKTKQKEQLSNIELQNGPLRHLSVDSWTLPDIYSTTNKCTGDNRKGLASLSLHQDNHTHTCKMSPPNNTVFILNTQNRTQNVCDCFRNDTSQELYTCIRNFDKLSF
ncbi:uncharacterized protein LOC117411093 isoform X2 [Acipenser ruthenus]|uniref:uncharacterized protein LOC117411093 isoform X2 n=1 Tax=Acipenser ruthenus TaxID=7906 RepID=UPI0027414629|nr:uncharacterized protein LOC117411093 isoform X2 [Acipenser ruthenus]